MSLDADPPRHSRMAWLALVALAAALGLAAWWLPARLAERIRVRAGLLTMEPKVLPRGIPNSLPSLVFGQVEVEAQVFIHNGTWLDLTLQDIHWRAYLKERQVAQGDLPQGQLLPSDREEPVKLRAVVSAPALGMAAVDMVRLRSIDIAVEVEGTVRVLGVPVHRSLRMTGFDLRIDPGQLLRLPGAPAAALPGVVSTPFGGP